MRRVCELHFDIVCENPCMHTFRTNVFSSSSTLKLILKQEADFPVRCDDRALLPPRWFLSCSCPKLKTEPDNRVTVQIDVMTAPFIFL